MKLEVEQKYRVVHPAELRSRLVALGAKFAPAVRQVDAYFNHPARDFAQTDEAFRIRSIGDENYLTYKGPKLDRTVKTRRVGSSSKRAASSALPRPVSATSAYSATSPTSSALPLPCW